MNKNTEKEKLIFDIDCDLITGDNTDNTKYDMCIQCYRYDICKACFESKKSCL